VRDWPPKRTQKRQFWPLKKKNEALRFYATMAAISSNGLSPKLGRRFVQIKKYHRCRAERLE
jgi:hypothetical protein